MQLGVYVCKKIFEFMQEGAELQFSLRFAQAYFHNSLHQNVKRKTCNSTNISMYESQRCGMIVAAQRTDECAKLQHASNKICGKQHKNANKGSAKRASCWVGGSVLVCVCICLQVLRCRKNYKSSYAAFAAEMKQKC